MHHPPWTGARSLQLPGLGPPPRPVRAAVSSLRSRAFKLRKPCAQRAQAWPDSVFCGAEGPGLQRIWQPRPGNPPQLFRLVRQYPAAEPPPIDRYCTFDHEKKEEPAVRSVGKNSQTVALMVRKALIAAQPVGNALDLRCRLLPCSANLRRRDRHQSTETRAPPFLRGRARLAELVPLHAPSIHSEASRTYLIARRWYV